MSEIQNKENKTNEAVDSAIHIPVVSGFCNGSYKMSTDYEKLWQLIKSGNRVPSWVVYDKSPIGIIWDIAEVKIMGDGKYDIGIRGISYKSWKGHGISDFIQNCGDYDLHFIEPCNSFEPTDEQIEQASVKYVKEYTKEYENDKAFVIMQRIKQQYKIITKIIKESV